MSNVVKFQTKTQLLADAIRANIVQVMASENTQLPGEDSELVKNFIKKIEGDYDLSLAKVDTDNAVELINIAYNSIPQSLGQGRVGLSKLQQNLLDGQKNAAMQMNEAAHTAQLIHKKIAKLYPIWRDVVDGRAVKELADSPDAIADFKDFIQSDLIPLTHYIEENSEQIANKLTDISKLYEALVKEAQAASIKTQESLAKEIKNRTDIQDDIAKNQADQAKHEAQQEAIVQEEGLPCAAFRAGSRDPDPG